MTKKIWAYCRSKGIKPEDLTSDKLADIIYSANFHAWGNGHHLTEGIPQVLTDSLIPQSILDQIQCDWHICPEIMNSIIRFFIQSKKRYIGGNYIPKTYLNRRGAKKWPDRIEEFKMAVETLIKSNLIKIYAKDNDRISLNLKPKTVLGKKVIKAISASIK